MTQNQIRYWEMVENHRANTAKEAETQRANMAKEALEGTKNAEIARHNQVTELHSLIGLDQASRGLDQKDRSLNQTDTELEIKGRSATAQSRQADAALLRAGSDRMNAETRLKELADQQARTRLQERDVAIREFLATNQDLVNASSVVKNIILSSTDLAKTILK